MNQIFSTQFLSIIIIFYFKLTMLLIKIIVFLACWLFMQVSPALKLPTVYQNVILNEKIKINIAQNTQLYNSAGSIYESIRVSDFYIERKTSEGKLELFDLSTKNLKYNMFLNKGNPTSHGIRAYHITDNLNDTFGVISGNNCVYLSKILTNGATSVFYKVEDYSSIIRNAIQLTQNELITLSYDAFFGSKIYRRFKKNDYNLLYNFGTRYNVPIYNMKTCQAPNNFSTYKIAIWKRNCITQIYQCQIEQSSCSSLYFENNTDCNSSQYGSQVRDKTYLDWNSDCTKIIYQSKNLGLKVVNVATRVTIVTFPYSNFGGELIGYWFLDDYDKFIGVAISGKFQIYDTSKPTSKIHQTIISANSVMAAYSKKNKMFLTSSYEELMAYEFTCLSSDYYYSSTGICLPIPIVPTTPKTPTNSTATAQTNTSAGSSNTSNASTVTNATDLSDSSSTSNGSNSSNAEISFQTDPLVSPSSQNQMQQDSFPSIDPNQQYESLPYDPSYGSLQNMEIPPGYMQASQNESLWAKFLQIIIPAIVQFLNVVVTLLYAFPFTYLFLRFINFWSICSMYLFLNFSFQTYLQIVLFQLFKAISTSIFTILGLSIIQVETNLEEKYDFTQNMALGLSSDFFNSSIQNFLFMSFSFLVLLLLLQLSKKLPKDSCIRSHLSEMNFKMAFLGQYIGIMNLFMFNFEIITSKSEHSTFFDKINITFHNAFFCFSAFVTPLVIILTDIPTKTKKQKKQNKIEKWNNFFDTACNAILPVLAIIKNKPLFLAFNSIFFCIPIYTAWKEKNCWAKNVLRSSYFTIFNLGSIFLELMNADQFSEISQYVSLFMLVLLLVGATHQILELVFGLLYDFFKFIRFRCSKAVGNSSTLNKNQKAQKVVCKTQKSKKQLRFIPRFENIKTKKEISRNDYMIKSSVRDINSHSLIEAAKIGQKEIGNIENFENVFAQNFGVEAQPFQEQMKKFKVKKCKSLHSKQKDTKSGVKIKSLKVIEILKKKILKEKD